MTEILTKKMTKACQKLQQNDKTLTINDTGQRELLNNHLYIDDKNIRKFWLILS